MSSKVQLIAVHYANRSGRSKPAMFLPYDTVREMVDARLAKWDKRCKYVNLTKTEAEMPKRQRSITMGVAVMDGCVEGNERDIACRDAWIPKLPMAA